MKRTLLFTILVAACGDDGASPSDGYATWTLLDASDSGRFFSDPLIDAARLETSDDLTVYYPERGSVNIWGLEYALQ